MDCRGAEILEEAGVEVIEIGDLAGLVREVNAHVLGPLTAPGESWRRSRRSQSLTTVSFQQPTVETTIRMDQGQNRALSGSVASVRLFSLEARAHARGGDRRNFERAMGLATEAFDRLPEQSTDSSIFSFSALYFPYYAGSCSLWLHQPLRALEQAETAITLCDAVPAEWSVARAVSRIDLATALVQLGQLDDACAVGSEALSIYACSRPIGPVVRRAAELCSALQQNQGVPAVRDFTEELHAICTDQSGPLA